MTRNARMGQRLMLLLSAGALGLALSAPAAAARSDRGTGTPSYDNGANETVQVTAPRLPEQRYTFDGTPIENVSLSQPVFYKGLDLRTHEGARLLRQRIRHTAFNLCLRLNFEYPISTPDSPPCYRTALQNAMPRADRAIREARLVRFDRSHIRREQGSDYHSG